MPKMPKEKYVRVCPKCGSTNVHADLSKDMIAWGGSTRMVCDDCGYSAMLFPEVLKSQAGKLKAKSKLKTEKQKRPTEKSIESKGIVKKTKFWGYFYLIIAILIILTGVITMYRDGLHEERLLVSLLMAALPLIIGIVLVIKRAKH